MHKTTFKVHPHNAQLEFSCKTADLTFTADTEDVLEQIDPEVIAEYLQSIDGKAAKRQDGDTDGCNKTINTTTKLLPRGRARWLQSQRINQCLCCDQKGNES